ncbi:unnamed protein product [Acanthoscelides obtectus]|uniref:Methylated-DNA--protein-cysteine methyltransferase n=1 Tax=Acanthoscelides obtectus TaxID=200917 RepID=A0A9P0PQ17_ACAOB|nr:unnamed protein product [Acanthoscelides obtectus]CAK1638413.1 Bifunctional transcriptional activator/DNA repair enzyme Ada [Acanthoscelides obtectus]
MMCDKPLVLHKMSPKDDLDEIYWGKGLTPIGEMILALHDNRICYLSFGGEKITNIDILKKTYPKANLQKDDDKIAPMLKNIFNDDPQTFEIIIKGTDFEVKVWEELAKIKRGTTVSYQDVAVAIGNPKAVRAVGTAVGNNPVSVLIPCHRVIRKGGDLGKYGGGLQNKVKLLRLENAI